MNSVQRAAFVRYLENLVPEYDSQGKEVRKGNRAALAGLRRALGQQTRIVPEAAAVVVPFLDADLNRPWTYRDQWREQVLYSVGGLFALITRDPPPQDRIYASQDPPGSRQPVGSRGDFGDSLLLHLRRTTGGDAGAQSDERGRVDRVFSALIDAEDEAVFDHLRRAVALLATSNVHPRWDRLISDLLRWDDDREVQRAWARSYWAPGPNQSSAVSPADAATPASAN